MWEFDLSLWEILFVFIVGIVAEIQGCIIGGGGFIAQPALLSLGLPGQIAIAHDVAAVCGSSIGAAYVFHKKKQINYRLVKWWMPGMIAGPLVGVYLLSLIPVEIIKYIIIGFSIAGALYIIFVRNKQHMGDIHEFKADWKLLSLPVSFLFGIFIGFSAAGSGLVATMIMLIIYGQSMKSSLGFKEAIHLIPSFVATIHYALLGWLSLKLFIPMFFAYLIGGYAGAHLAVRIPENILKGIFIAGVFVFSTLALMN